MADFELLGGDDDETRLLRERSSGYSVPLPGHPRLVAPPAGLPRYDVIIQLRDVEVEYGFRLDALPTQVDAQALALMLATGYINARGPKRPAQLKPLPFRPKGITGGVHDLYTIAVPDAPDDSLMEQLWLMIRPAPDGLWALYHTTRFRTSALNHIQWAHLRTSTIDQHEWDPQHPREVAPSLWPASTFALPSAKLELTEREWQEAAAKAEDIGPLRDEQTVVLIDGMRQFAMIDQPPRLALTPFHHREYMRQIAMVGPSQAAEALLRNIDRCGTLLDLRAWTWQCVWAIANRKSLQPEQRRQIGADEMRTVQIDLHDALQAVTDGAVHAAPYTRTIYCRAPSSWLGPDGQFLPERVQALLRQLYGPNWQQGNTDGSRYVVLKLEMHEMSPSDAVRQAWLPRDDDHVRGIRRFYYLGRADGTFETLDANGFSAAMSALR